MKFYTKTHPYYCGIDLHAKTLYVCIVDSEGTICIHKNIKAVRRANQRAVRRIIPKLLVIQISSTTTPIEGINSLPDPIMKSRVRPVFC